MSMSSPIFRSEPAIADRAHLSRRLIRPLSKRAFDGRLMKHSRGLHTLGVKAEKSGADHVAAKSLVTVECIDVCRQRHSDGSNPVGPSTADCGTRSAAIDDATAERGITACSA
jgi:hypothetical protein